MRKLVINGAVIATALILSACAQQPKPTPTTVQTAPIAEQDAAAKRVEEQARTEQLVLKRKVAIGRFSNETLHGRSLLRDSSNDTLGKQVSDMLTQRLIESGQFLVLERPDITRLRSEAELSQQPMDLAGADTLIMGSLVEFGRSTDGTTGFWSKTKKQTAKAKVALRLVDPTNGLAYFSATGAGEASTETGEVAFVGSTAAYDGTLNDAAIASAIADVVNDIIENLTARPWSTKIIMREGSDIFIAGGKLQGLRPGLKLKVQTEGRKMKSPQTGFMITLPGKPVATLEIVSVFGNTETDEGSIARVISGTIEGFEINSLVVTEHD